jgi:hypothetical protein
MKTYFKWAAALVVSACLLSSCAVSSIREETPVTGKKAKNEKNALPCFVELKNGSIRQFNSLKLITSPFAAPHLLADGKEKLQTAAIKAYQTDKLYAVTQEIFADNIRSKSAVETLPGFASRIVNGTLTIYCKKYYNGRGTAEQLFVQKDGGEIFAFSPGLLETLLKENAPAKDLFKKLSKVNPVSKRVVTVAELFNKDQSLSKN